MKGEWCYFNKVLSKQECQNIVKACKKEIMHDATVTTDAIVDKNIRKSRVYFLDREIYKEIYNFIWLKMIEANRQFFNFNIQDCDNIQFTEYCSKYKGEYKPHIDTFWLKDTNHRKISCILQLSDPEEYEGGDFFISANEQPNKEELKNQGTLFFFPSFYEHGVAPVTKGKRYSLVCWFTGPHFV